MPRSPVFRQRARRYSRRFTAVAAAAAVVAALLAGGGASPSTANSQTDIPGPAGSGLFGGTVLALPNGNIVVADPSFDAPGAVANVGAVYLYNGSSGALISTLTGSTEGDQVGGGTGGGMLVLANGNFLVRSPSWSAPGPVSAVGAATWCSASSGCAGAVSAANSLVGATAGDQVGGSGATALTNGNYVVVSLFWDAPGPVADVGAATWCSGTGGCTGAVSAANSLVGATADDRVGNGGATVLTNGNYVVRSPNWDAPGPVSGAGAATWCSGTGGCTGAVSAANSLVGATADDRVGESSVTPLPSGNYVVRAPLWDAPGPLADAGAVTWCGGTAGCTGAMSVANSLVGATAGDQVGNNPPSVLTNGNFVVPSPNWDLPSPSVGVDAGAVTWCSSTAACTGAVSAANSLVGATAGDQVGGGGLTVLTNGNYVVRSPSWDAPGPVSGAGAATWCSGTGGCTGAVSAANSLVGATASDGVGGAVTALTNGNYVVRSPNWDAPGPVVDVGAATWCSGSAGCTGAVAAANSLVGATAGDRVALFGATALGNSNYVVGSPFWDAPGPAADAGAATWCSGTGGCTGAVSAANSLVGATAGDLVANNGVNALSNGNYVVRSPSWDAPGPVADVGAMTWCSGTSGCTGAVSLANSLVGATSGDLASSGVTPLTNGNYVVGSLRWDGPGPVVDAGAATWCSGASGCIGPVSAANSLVGATAGDLVASSVTELTNGNYVVGSGSWDAPGPVVDAGAMAWCSGASGCTGAVSVANSLVGSTASDQVGLGIAFNNGATDSYVVRSNNWDAPGPVSNSGAVTWCSALAGCIGPVSAGNSVLGTAAGGGASMVHVFEAVNEQLAVGRPSDKAVSLRIDVDNDFVRNAVEDAAPGGGDGNLDGLPDDHQPNIASLPNAADGAYATLAAPSGMSLASVKAVPNPSPGDAPAGVLFPAGFFEFQLFPMPVPPSSAVVELHLAAPTTTEEYWLYGSEPAPGSALDHWYRFDPVAGSPATGATSVSTSRWDLTLVDGARGDDDAVVDRTLVNLGGPGGLLRGDCNGDGAVNAADVSAVVLEIFDGDGSAPLAVPGGTFPGSPIGCNANADAMVDAGDMACTVRLIFGGGTCGP